MVLVAITLCALTKIQTNTWGATAHYQIWTQRTWLRQPLSSTDGLLLPISTQQVKTWVLSLSICIQWLCSWKDSFSFFLLILLSSVLVQAWHWLIYFSEERATDKTVSGIHVTDNMHCAFVIAVPHVRSRARWKIKRADKCPVVVRRLIVAFLCMQQTNCVAGCFNALCCLSCCGPY